MFGESVSAPTVSRVIAHLDDETESFHSRPLSDRYRYLYLDGLWVTLRKPVKVRKVILVALGVLADGSRELVSFQLAPSESESCWWGFLSDMKERGVRTPQLVITDGAAGLIKAVQALYPRSDHQRCGVHKAFEAASRVEDSRRCRSFRQAAVGVFEAQTVGELRARLKAFTDRWTSREPRAVQAFVRGLDGCLTYLRYPPPLHKKLYNTNLIERYIEEIRRRTIPMRSFNNARSAERIIYGIIAYVLNQNPMEMPEYQFTQHA
jgi:transposase-like protein